MPRALILVFNDIKTDSRIIRTANTLSECEDYEVEVVGFGDKIDTDKYKSVVLNSKHNRGLKRYIAFLKMLKVYLNDNKFDYLYANDFYSAIPIILWGKRFSKIIYDAHELYIPNVLSKMGLKSYIFYKLEKVALKRANGIICAQHDRAIIMEIHYKLKKTPTVVQNISKLHICNKMLPDQLEIELDKFFKKNIITIVYAGKVRPDSKVQELINELERSGKSYNLLVVGGGEDLYKLKESAMQLKKINVFFTDTLPFDMMGSVLKRCSIAYMYYPDSNLNNKYCAPNKLYEYASLCLPTVCNENPTVKAIYEQWGIGVCNNNIFAAINECVANLDTIKTNCQRFNEIFTWEKEKKKLSDYCKEVFNDKS